MAEPASINVASRLAHFAAVDPDRAAVIIAANDQQRTFRELHANSDALAHGLIAAGIIRGTRVALMAPPSLEFFTLVFALFKVAAVPVMIDPGMGAKNLGKCLEDAEPQAFIGIPKAHLARRLLGWAKGCIAVNVGGWKCFCPHSTSSLRELGQPKGPFPMADVAADEMAAILFTSGSTGPAKGVVYTHGIFSTQVDMLKQIYGIKPGEVDLCTFPLFALFGPALGMTCVVPTMNFSEPIAIDVRQTVATIHQYQVTNLFGSPAVIKRLAYQDRHLATLKRAISAGAPANLGDIQRFNNHLEESAQIFTPYGATEALPVANIGSRELLETRSQMESGAGICIGRPVQGVIVHVIPISDDAMPVFHPGDCLPTGEIGEFVVGGPIVTRSYWKRDDATRLAKMRHFTTGEILHRMGDVGYYDERGRLWYCGRKSHRVVTTQGTLFTEQVEAIFNAGQKHFRTALVGVPNGLHREPILICEWGDKTDPIEYLKSHPRQHPIVNPIRTFLAKTGGFPVDPRHNSKINREALAVWAAEQLRKKKA